MDRASSSQLAGRNIKQAKSRRRTPLRSDGPVQQSMSFQGGDGGAGLFGGSVQAPGTFSFAPSGGPSFPPATFGNSFESPDASDNEDPRADTTGEEAARRKRGFERDPNSSLRNPYDQPSSFGQSQKKPADSLFQFGSSQQATSEIPNQAQNQPSANPFSFNPTQSAPSSPGISFGSGSAQEKPESSIFRGFGQQTTQPAAAPFAGFMASSTTPAPSQFPFSSTKQPTTTRGGSMNEVFGNSQTQPAPSSTLFASSGAPTSNIFGNLTPTTPSTNIGQPASTPTLFGGLNSTAPTTSSGQPASTSNPFGKLNSTAAPPTSNGQPPSTSTIFGGLTSTAPSASNGQPASTSTIFGGLTSTAPSASNGQPASTSTVFGGLTSTAPSTSNGQPASTSTVFGGLTSTAPSTSNGQPAPTSTIFGGLTSPAPSTSNGQPASMSNIFGTPTSTAPLTKTLFGSQPQPSTPSNPLFGARTQQPQSTSSIFGNLGQTSAKPTTSGSQDSQSTSSATSDIFGGLNKPANATNPFTTLSQQPTPSSNIFGGSEKLKPPPAELFGASNKPVGQSVAQSNDNGALTNSTGTDGVSKNGEPSQSPSKTTELPKSAAFQNSSATNGNSNALKSGQLVEKTTVDAQYRDMSAAAALTDEALRPKAPPTFSEEQRSEFCAAYRLRSLNKALASFLGSVPPSVEVTSAFAFYTQKRDEILNRCSVAGSKRKASENEDQENDNPSKRNKQFAPTSTPSDRAPAINSPEKSFGQNFQQPFMNGSTSPKAPMFTAPPAFNAPPAFTAPPTSAASPSFSQNAAPYASPSTKGKRKADNQLTKDDYEEEERQSKRLNMNGGLQNESSTNGFSISGSPTNGVSRDGESTGSNTSAIFKSILDTPQRRSPEKKVKSLPEASKDETPKSNPFGNLPVPSSSATAKPPSASVAPSNIFAPKITPIAATANPFQPKPATTNTNEPASPPKSTIKPPNFGSGSGKIDFFAQFNQKASKDTAKDAAERMQKAKDDEFDSEEDDEAEWEAKYKAKQEKEKKAVEELASKRASFVPGQGFSFGQAKPTSDTGTNNSVFSSINGSRTPTPTSFGIPGDNIFAHLASDPPSGKDDDDDTDSEEDGEADGDSENKDPSYQPVNGSSGRGTPVDETGPGIAPAKKTPFGEHNASVFNPSSAPGSGLFGTSRTMTPSGSGSATPSRGGLFDRITKDLNGNPMRQLPSEEKENTQPSTTTNIFNDVSNPFASSFTSKTTEAPADQTWKKDSPIRFGSATPGTDAANPVVSITTATPTKIPQASPFANLFGNSATPKSVLPSAPTGGPVGFSFGGSTASSLLPSAAVSASTSRATSPGTTTDGESAAEGDPDAEKHEQINLTAGGPGEENEDVLHEVRAKALLFSKSEKTWDSKGLGPLRILRNRETNATRILLRADPSGSIILNKSILPQKYESNAKTVKVTVAGEGGKGLETWLLQVKSAEAAKELAEGLESSKP